MGEAHFPGGCSWNRTSKPGQEKQQARSAPSGAGTMMELWESRCRAASRPQKMGKDRNRKLCGN